MWKAILGAVMLGTFSGPALAEGWSCWHAAGKAYHLPPTLLYSIALVESGNRAWVVNRNTNGTYDLGVMQINSMHLPRLARYGITAQKLLADPCLNVHVGAMILRENIDRYGWSWRAIGAYNAGSEHKRAAYARKVIATHHRVVAAMRQSAAADG